MHPRTWRLGALLTAPLAVLGLALTLGMSTASAATISHGPLAFGAVHRTFRASTVHGTNETAVTRLSFRLDSGLHGDWAYDSFTRTDHMVRVGPANPALCGFSVVHACWKWQNTITDSAGSFQTVLGQASPGSFDFELLAVEQGSFSGSQPEIVYDSYANAFPGDVPVTENDNGNMPSGNSTSLRWPCQFFGGVGSCHPQGASSFSYSYAVPAGADSLCPSNSWHWVNASDGNVGDILAPNRATCASEHST